MSGFILNEENFLHWIGELKIGDKNVGALSDGVGNLTLGLEIRYPAVFSMNETGYEDLFNGLVKIMNASMDGTYWHALDFYSVEQNNMEYESKKFSTKYHYRQFDGTGILRHRSFMFLTYEYKLTEDIKINYGISGGKKKGRVLDSINDKDYAEYVKLISNDFKSKVSKLNGLKGVKISLLDHKKIKAVVGNYMNQSYAGWENNPKGLEPVNNNDVNLLIGNKYVGVSTVTSFPEELCQHGTNAVPGQDVYGNGIEFAHNVALPKSFAYPMGIGLPINHVVSSVIGYPGSEKIEKRIKDEYAKDRLISFFKKTEFEKKKQLIVDHEGVIGSGQWFSTLLESNLKPVTFSQQIISLGRTQEEVFDHQEFVSQSLDNIGSGVGETKENAYALHFFMGNCPGLIRNNRISNYVMTTNQGLTMLPRETHEKSDSRGHLYLDRSGNPIIIDMRYKPLGTRINNQNKLVFGPSGFGKSVMLNDYLSQCYNLGYHFLVLDVGGSYESNAQDMGVKYIDSKNNKEFRFNPFLVCSKRDDGTFIYKIEVEDENELDEAELAAAQFVVNSIYAVLDCLIRDEDEKVSKDTKIAIKKAIEAYYIHVNKRIKSGESVIPKLTEFYGFVDKYRGKFDERFGKGVVNWKSVLLRLEPFAVGEHESFLNADEVIDVLSDRGIVIDAKAINDNVDRKDVAMVCITQLAMDKLERLPVDVPKTFIIDEAVDFLVGDVGDFIAGLFRKIRKIGGEVIIATQDAKFLRSADQLVFDSIIGNSATRILLGLNDDSLEDAKLMLSLTDNDLRVIDSMENHAEDLYRPLFIKFEKTAKVIRVMMSKEALWTYTTHPDERPIRDRVFKKYKGNTDLALEALINGETK
ncbi:MAG: hypothetical protein ABJH98_17735 [Reichenbachiella sp.]|uniref:VirB4 family type IV secretion system protein n=1 Tax=Reichenbachiella sp. TaxID=2184521 RepID=UPI00329A742F